MVRWMSKKPSFRWPLERQHHKKIQMKLSQKGKTFSEFFFPFLKSILNFKYLPKKGEPHTWCVSGNYGSEKYR